MPVVAHVFLGSEPKLTHFIAALLVHSISEGERKRSGTEERAACRIGISCFLCGTSSSLQKSEMEGGGIPTPPSLPSITVFVLVSCLKLVVCYFDSAYFFLNL